MQEKTNLLSDQQLLQLFKESGNNKYLGILLQRYTILLFGACMKYLKDEDEAKDAVQQVFIKAINEIGKYEITYFKSWIYTIARNYCLMELRKAKNHTAVEIEEDLPNGELDPLEEKFIREKKEQLLTWIEEGLEQLQEPQRQCVTLFYLQKQSYDEISRVTGHSLMQVKSAIQNGKRNIRIWVEKQRNHHAS